MRNIVIILLFLFRASFISCQISAIDTLIIFGNKYKLNRIHVYLTGSDNSFLSTTPCRYSSSGTSTFKYLTQAGTNCKASTVYDAQGDAFTENYCFGKREMQSYLNAFKDSILIDFNKLDYEAIKLKSKNNLYYFDLIEYSLQYDTCNVTISLDQSAKSNYDVIHHIFKRLGKPTMILLTQMFYIDPKTGIAYKLPFQFVFLNK